MRAAEIAASLGDARRSAGGWWRCRCPVHGSAGASLALRDGERGLIARCWAGCQSHEVLAALRRRGLLAVDAGEHVAAEPPDPAIERRRREARAADRQRRIALSADIWGSSWPAGATSQIRRYLAGREITIPAPPSIRLLGMFGPYGRHPGGQCRPQMVGLVEHVDHGAVGIHRTFLALDGCQKAALDPVRICHGPIGGGAVRLAEMRRGVPLVVAEGIESALAALELSGWPAWAALSAGGIERLVLPAEARDIVIACDRDPSSIGERSARIAAARWHAEGRRVRLVIPDRIGADANDLLREVRRAA